MGTSAYSESQRNSNIAVTNPVSPIETIRVLHLDDEENQQMFLKVFVESDPSIKVISTKNVIDTIELVKTGAYDCLVSDYDMPETNGLELAKTIREFSNIPIIIYTGRGSEEIAEKAFAVGIDDYIRKEQEPAHYQVVSNRIRQAVERKRSNETYKNLFEKASDSIMIVAFNGHVIDVNEVGCKRYGYSKAEFRRMTINQYVASPGFDFEDYLEKITRKSHVIFEATHLARDGRLIPVEVNAKIIKYNGVDAILSFSRDISDRRRLEARMKERLEALQTHALELSKCDDIESIAHTTYTILHNAMAYSFFGLGLVKGDVLSFIPNTIADTDWSLEYPLITPGVCTRAVNTGSTVVVPDVRLDPDYIGPKQGYKYLSELAVPVKVGGRVAAVINIEDPELNHFTRDDAMLIEVFSEHVAAAIHRIIQLDKTKRYLARIDAMNRHTVRLAQLNTVKEVAEYSINIIRELIGFEDGCIGIVEDDVIRFRYARNRSYTIPDRIIHGKGITARAVRTGEPQLVPDTRLDPDFAKDLDPEEYLSELDVPVKINDSVVAVINLEDPRPGYFAEEDKEIVQILAVTLGSSIGRINLLESVKRLSANLEALKVHAEELTRIESVEGVAKFSYEVIEKLLGFNEGAFGVVDGEHIKYIYARTIPVEKIPLMPLSGRGISVRAVKTSKTQLIPDIRLDPDFVRDVETSDIYSELDVPVKADGKVIAVLNLEKAGLNAFSYDDQRIVEVLSEQVASALTRIEYLKVIKKSEEALTESEERFKYILNSAPEGVIVNVRCRLVYTNEQFAKMMGYTPEELIDKNIVEFHKEEYRGLIEDRTLRRFQGEEVPTHYEVELVRKDGSSLPVEYSVSQIVYEGQNASLTFIRDISQRREKQELERKMESLHRHARVLNELQSIQEVAEATLEMLHSHLKCDLLSIRSVVGDYTHPLVQWGNASTGKRMPINGKGVTTRAVREKRSMLVQDTRLDRDFIRGNADTLSELAVPIMCKDEVLGVLNAESLSLSSFHEDDRLLMETLADEVGSAFKRIQILDSERNHVFKLNALELNAVKLSQSRSVDKALDCICEILESVFKYKWAGIGRVGEKSIKYVRVLGVGLGDKDTIPLDRRCVTVRAVKTGVSQLVPDTAEDKDYVLLEAGDEIFKSELVVPIRVNEKIEYILNLEGTEPNAFSDQDRHLMELLSIHFGSAVEIIRNREKLNYLQLHASNLESTRDIEDIAWLTLETLKQVLNFRISSFHLVNGDVAEMISSSVFTQEVKFTQPLRGRGLIPRAIRERRSLYAPDVSVDEDYVRGPLKLDDRSSEFVVPIIIDGVPVAAINLENGLTDSFSEGDREMVELLAEHVASAMHRIRHRQAIKSSDERYRSLLDNSLDSVIVIQGTKIVYANTSAAKLRGYDSPNEIVGRESIDFIPEDERRMIRSRQLSKQRGEPQPVRYYMRLLRRDGAIVEVENIASAISFDGKPAVLAVARDLTHIRKLEERLMVLHSHAVKIGAVKSIDEVSAVTVDAIKVVMGYDLVSFLINEEDNLRSIRNAGSEVRGWLIPISGKGITAKAAREKRTILVNDLSKDPDFILGSTPSQSELATPILVYGKTVAVLNVESTQVNAFTPGDAKILETLAQHVASAFERMGK